jgi:hypothetical protein
MALPRIFKTAVTLGVVVALVLVGEAPALAGVRLLVIPQTKRLLPGLSGGPLFMAECVIATGLIFLAGMVLGIFSVRLNRPGPQKPPGRLALWATRQSWIKKITEAKQRLTIWAKDRGWSKEHWVARFLRKGQPLYFVIASYVGGAALVGWWYARKDDPNDLVYATWAALILAAASGVLWVSAFNPGYSIWTAIVIGGELATALTLTVFRGWRPQSVL